MLFHDTPIDIKIGKNRVLFSISQNRLWFIFLAFNFAFLTLDTYIAHFLSQFLSVFIGKGLNPADTSIVWQKYIPFIFSPIFAIFLLKVAITDVKSIAQKNGMKIFAYGGIIIGILGFYYHLLHKFFFLNVSFTENIIFGPPLLAPIMYVILSLYILSILWEDKVNYPSESRNKFLIYLTSAQILVLVLLAAFEHSHNYFASIYEWIPLVVGFFTFTFLLFSVVVLKEKGKLNSKLFNIIFFSIMIISVITGVFGFGFHVYRNATMHIHGVSNYFVKVFVGSPIFAPLLFANASIFMILVYLKINIKSKKKILNENIDRGKIRYISKGYSIKIQDNSSNDIVDAKSSKKVAIKPTDFIGLKPKLDIDIGDKVKIGDIVAHDKFDPRIKITSPVTGKILEIIRGYRRIITEIVIETDHNNESKHFQMSDNISKNEILQILLESGLFLFLKQRPFNKICSPNSLPRDIFVSGMDTAPLSTDENIILQNNEENFQKGLSVLSTLTSGKVHLSTSPDKKYIFDQYHDIELHLFQGLHPTGNVGIQIHHIAPVLNRDDIVWTCNIKGIIQIGKLFSTGMVDSEILVKVSGNRSENSKYFRTVMGADISSFVETNDNARIVSGDILTGTKIEKNGYVGFFDSLISIIPEAEKQEFLGWIAPGFSKLSKSRTFLSSFNPFKKYFNLDTRYHGSHRTFVSTGNYEDVLPMDIYPVFLMKAILANDIEEMESLGIYEVVEEDVALCEYICPSKIEWQEILRKGLNLIEKEG